MSSDVYVYYRIAPAAQAAAANAVSRVFALLAPHCAAPPQLKQRCDDASTWMEIYPGVHDFAAFQRALTQALRQHPLLTAEERHVECFAARALPAA